jgi:hypothetical protein
VCFPLGTGLRHVDALGGVLGGFLWILVTAPQGFVSRSRSGLRVRRLEGIGQSIWYRPDQGAGLIGAHARSAYRPLRLAPLGTSAGQSYGRKLVTG